MMHQGRSPHLLEVLLYHDTLVLWDTLGGLDEPYAAEEVQGCKYNQTIN